MHWAIMAFTLGLAWPGVATSPLAAAERVAAEPNVTWSGESGQVTLVNGRLQLIIETKSGINARSLRDLKSGQVYADRDCSWLGDRFPQMEKDPVPKRQKEGSQSVV